MRKLYSSIQYILLAIILATSFTLMINSSLQESAIMDELAHIPAGYGYVKYFDYRLNPEHPPLVKIISAIPLVFQHLSFPTDSKAWQTDINGQWETGNLFIFKSGNDANTIVNWARLGPMLLTLILIFFVFIWSKELIGIKWALLPTVLTAFSPTILSHGHYVTTDIGATLGVFLSLFYFVKFIQNRSKKNLLIAGIAYGIAQLMKFSAILIIPLLGFLIIIFSFYKGFKDCAPFISKLGSSLKEFTKLIGYLITIFIIGYLLVYIVYFPITQNYPMQKQQADTEAILVSFSNKPGTCLFNISKSLNTEVVKNPMQCLTDLDIWMTQYSITKPFAQYLLGVLMVIQRATGGNTGYLLGEVSNTGWWYYFPVVFALKEPIPSLMLIAIALLLGCSKFFKNIFTAQSRLKDRFFNYISLNFAEFSMLSYIILYWAYSIKSPLNIGVRHILPTLPFMYIVSTQILKNWTRHNFEITSGFFRNLFMAIYTTLKTSIKMSVIIILIAWYIIEAFIAYPHFISYFNEFAGGKFNGYKYVTDSNYDWGQDLKRLGTFIKEQKINKIAVNYFGGGDIYYHLGENHAVDWYSSKGNPKYEGINYIAISINNLQNVLGNPGPGFEIKPEDKYTWLTKIKDPYNPDYKIGTTIFVYKLD